MLNARPRSVRWDERLALLVSYAGSPPVLISLMTFLSAAIAREESGVWLWSVGYLAVAIVLPVARLIWLVKRRVVADLDVQLRKQRIEPLFNALVLGSLAWGLVTFGGAPAPIRTLATALGVLEVLILTITVRWKISVHSAVSAAAAWMVWHYLGLLWVPLTAVVLIVWSRLHLQRHTVLQTLAGIALGATVFYLAVGSGAG